MEAQNVRKVYKYKLTPTPEQASLLERTLALCFQVYNAAIGERREAWRLCGVSVTYYQQKAELPGIKEAIPEYAQVHTQVLQDVVLRVDRTFQAFFHRIKAATRQAIRASRAAAAIQLFTYPQYGDMARCWTAACSASPRSAASPSGCIAPCRGTPKTVTISREADGWYACISCADVPTTTAAAHRPRDRHRSGHWRPSPPLPMARMIHTPPLLSPGRGLSADAAQRRVARRQKGSNRRHKAVNLLAKAHQQVTRQRRDFHHKTALALVSRQRYHLSRSLADGQYAQESSPRQEHPRCGLERVLEHPRFQSSICWEAGHRRAVLPSPATELFRAAERLVSKGLSVRWHRCPYEDCGARLHRDHNAARNILALAAVGRGAPLRRQRSGVPHA